MVKHFCVTCEYGAYGCVGFTARHAASLFYLTVWKFAKFAIFMVMQPCNVKREKVGERMMNGGNKEKKVNPFHP